MIFPFRVRPAASLRFKVVFLGIAGFTLATAGIATRSDKKVARPALYVVGYSHLDTQWCWSYPQVIREFIPNTLHENFALFSKYPDYVFNWTGSNRYRLMKEYYPADYAKLKKYIAEGRWFPAGSSVEEGDVNSPSEESLIRQILYGNEYFRKEFGKQSSEYMLPDCFGFPASLPSILAHCGLKGFSTQKLTWGSAVGIPFNVGRWVGPDGNWIVAALNAEAYDSQVKTNLAQDKRWIKRLDEDASKDGVSVDYHYYGVGDRGGAPDEASVKLVTESTKTAGPVHVFAGRADQMFNDLTARDKEKLPTYSGDLELTEHSAGSLTSEAAVKRWNRKNEQLASATESCSVAANWLGALPYDKGRITDAWLRFLPGQFHDLMAGTALPVAYNYTWNDQIIAMNEFAGVLQASAGAVTRALDTRTVGVPLSVYNPLSVDRTDVVEANVTFPAGVPSNVQVFDSKGTALPTQIVSRTGNSARVLFTGRVPSMGFAVFDVRSVPAAGGKNEGTMHASRRTLENSRYAVTIDDNGDVSSVWDKANKREMLSSPARLVYMHENPRNFPAWNMDWTDQRQSPRGYVTGTPTIEVLENGPVRVALRITRRHEGSKFVQTLRLGTGDAAGRLEFVTQIDWQGRESALKAEFPLTVSNPDATYNWELGTIQRGTNDPKKYEVPSHGWIDVTDKGGSFGASILDDCKYGSDKPNDNTLRLTLLYSPGVRGGYQHQATQDWGRNEMVYALTGHSGTWRDGNSQWQAAELNQPLKAFQTIRHPGSLGGSFSFAQTSSPDVSVEALKQAEDSNEVVVRLNELSGRQHDGAQIKFAVPVISAREVDGQERPIRKCNVAGGKIVLDMKPYEPRAFAVRLAKPGWSLSAVASRPLSLPYNAVGISSGFGAHDANFDGSGKSLPGDQVPSDLTADGVEFKLGPKGANNMVTCVGQSIRLPAGIHRKLYLLGASAQGDTKLPLDFGECSAEVTMQSWKGYIGQWDTREWGGKVPELAYDWHNPITGLVPGFIKRQPIAWYSDHTRLATGENDIYSFCYLFRASVDVPDGATQVTLPANNPARLLAATVAQNPGDATIPAVELYDSLERGDLDGPSIAVAKPAPAGEAVVTLQHPLYWSDANPLHYTLDGSVPDLSSPLYKRPFGVGRSGTLTVAQLSPSGAIVSEARLDVDVSDTAPPSVVGAVSLPGSSLIKVQFGEEVAGNSASDPTKYKLDSDVRVLDARLAEDGRTVTLWLSADPAPETQLSINGVRDLGGNPASTSVRVKVIQPVYSHEAIESFQGTGAGFTDRNSQVPTGASSSWTLNMFVYTGKAPEDLTIIGGFGSGRDDSGQERFIISSNGNIVFWGSNVDISGGSPFDLNHWQMITASYDGHLIRLYKNGKLLKEEAALLSDAESLVRLGPRPAWGNGHRFSGKIAGVTIWDEALAPSFIQSLRSTMPKL